MYMGLPSGYKTVRISKSKYKDFIDIYREAFKSNIRIDYTEDKFNTIPISGIENIGYIVYHSETEPVSYYGVYPLYAYLNSKKVLVSQSGDTMTKPAHIGFGLFMNSAELTYNLCKENQIKGVFGFPSPSSYPTTKKKLNWKFNGKIKKYSFAVPTVPIAYIAEKIKFLKPLYLWWVRMILLFYKDAGFFEGSVVSNGQDGVFRDKAFWNYKMNSRNNFAIKIKGTDVVIKTNGMLCIGDVNINSESEIRPILKKLKLLSFLTFNAHLVFFLSPGTLLDEKLSAVKEGIDKLPIGFINFTDEYDLSSLKFTYFDFDTF
jgi:hypothetical protein